MSMLSKDIIDCAGLQAEVVNELCVGLSMGQINQKYKREWDIRVKACTSSIGKIYSALTDKFSLQNSMAFKVVKTLQTKSYFLSVNCQSNDLDPVHEMKLYWTTPPPPQKPKKVKPKWNTQNKTNKTKIIFEATHWKPDPS